MLVFDQTQAESYDNLENWKTSFVQTTGDLTNEIPIVVLGNKADIGINIEKGKAERDWVSSGKAKYY